MKLIRVVGIGIATTLLFNVHLTFADDSFHIIRGRPEPAKPFIAVTRLNSRLLDLAGVQMASKPVLVKSPRLLKLKETLSKHVAEGKLTQAQADELYARMEQSESAYLGPESAEDDFSGLSSAEIEQLSREKLQSRLNSDIALGKITQQEAQTLNNVLDNQPSFAQQIT